MVIVAAKLSRDLSRNRASIKSLVIVASYRFSSWFAQHPSRVIRIVGVPVRLIYKLSIELILGVELPDKVRAGPGLAVFHGVGLVVNHETIIGSNVTLRQNTTIGSRVDGGPAPIIGDDVSIGANAVIIGDIKIGPGSIIGAGAIVVESCGPNSIISSPKAKVRCRD